MCRPLRYTDDLARLETCKKDLEDALMRLARDEAEAQDVAKLAQELENQVESARAATGGHGSEFRRVDLTPDLSKADLNTFTTDLHYRLLAGCGNPPRAGDCQRQRRGHAGSRK